MPDQRQYAGYSINELPKVNTDDGTNTILVVTTTGELQLTDTLKPDNDQWLIGSFTYIANDVYT